MILTLFNNNRGMIRRDNPRRLISAYGGILKIGDSIVTIQAKTQTELPILCDGQTGEFAATFTDENGKVYNLFNVHLVDGRIATPSAELEQFVSLYIKAQSCDRMIERLQQEKQEAINALNNHPLKYLIE